ncbi:MAG: ABC transporter permease [Gemmataceae bacterium]|nr:ABC transporter permease [Gemmataceae bacterium]MDW8265702.1 ABC transporter permease [Gemmataceae bacterium]
MATAQLPVSELGLAGVGARLARALELLGDWTIFSLRTVGWAVRRRPSRGTLTVCLHEIGVRSVGVVALTGTFIGMVLAVQAYAQFHKLGLDTRLGAIINLSVVRELGPVLAATMLAGRVGSAMAAELATMRITEQIDALACLGINPVHYLVVPRFLACLVLVPLLTVLADFMGVMGGAWLCFQVFHIEPHHYWHYSREYVGMYDLWTSLVKPIFFGAAIALISCHRGFNSRAGAEGVGRAATEAFVVSFIAILVIDFFLAMFFTSLYHQLWPEAAVKFI